jgi:antibiotic biosynthesis monooxygenase (ABM) superfamily enzyme
MLTGHDDVHLVRDSTAGVRLAPVSAVISSRAMPGKEAAFRAWEQRIAGARAKSSGFQGYRFESPERKKLLEEATPFLEAFHARVVRTGFEQWLPSAADGGSPPAAWKQNMIVLLLCPMVFLFGIWVQTPF